MLHGFAFFATAAFQQHAASFFVLFRNGGKVDAPKVDRAGIQESHAVGVGLAFGTDAADNADQGFFVGIELANDNFLLGGELIGGSDAGSVAAQKDGLGHFRKAFAVHVASGQKDSHLFRNAAAAAKVFVGHAMHSLREVLRKAKVNCKRASPAQKLEQWFQRGKGESQPVGVDYSFENRNAPLEELGDAGRGEEL